MNKRSDINRVLEIWMGDGPSTMPDRVIDVVADRINRNRQRPSWRLVWRRPMNSQLKLLAAAAAVLVLAVVGWNLLPKQPSVGGPDPSPSQTTSPSETSSSAPMALLEGPLEAGRYRFQPFIAVPSLSIIADIPSGWEGVPSWAVVAPGGTEAPDGLGIAFLRADGLHSDPCHWDVDGTGAYEQPGDVEVGPSVDDLVAGLRASTAYSTSETTPITFREFEGSREFEGVELEIQLPTNLDFATACDKVQDGSDGDYFVFSGVEAGLWAQGNGNRWHVFIVDVNGTRVLVVGGYYVGTPTALLDAAGAIFESLEFKP